LVLAAIITPFIYFYLGPDLAPGNMTTSAASQQFDMRVLLSIAAPIMLIVYVWFGYNLIVFRYRGNDKDANGVWIKRDSVKLQIGWVLGTACAVLFLFGFGTYELVTPAAAGAGGGEGPTAIWGPKDVKEAAVWSPATKPVMLQVQVIGQQWQWTYRYPQFGGMETTFLELPVNTEIQFNVTSLDVIHSFWAYDLGVKADANPGINDIAFTKATKTGNFEVRCSELCGIWHGAMIGNGAVVSQNSFYSWAQSEKKVLASVTKELPKYSLSYTPSYTGAGGGYFDGRTSPSKKPIGS
jgi:cytochrome c oxidase subunit 2